MKNIKGKTFDEMYAGGEKEKVYPSLYVSEDDIPEINSWKVGEEYEMKVKVVMTSKDEFKSGQQTTARLEVVAYENLTINDDDPSTPKPGAVYGFHPERK